MDLVAQVNLLKKRLNDQAIEAQEMRDAMEHLTTLEENNAAMIAEMMTGLIKSGALVVEEKIGLTLIDGGKK